MKVCPHCGHNEFLITAIERHTWTVDGSGDYVDDEGCHEADIADGTDWTCKECESVYEGPQDLINPETDFDPPDADDYDEKYAYERMTDLEYRYNRM